MQRYSKIKLGHFAAQDDDPPASELLIHEKFSASEEEEEDGEEALGFHVPAAPLRVTCNHNLSLLSFLNRLKLQSSTLLDSVYRIFNPRHVLAEQEIKDDKRKVVIKISSQLWLKLLICFSRQKKTFGLISTWQALQSDGDETSGANKVGLHNWPTDMVGLDLSNRRSKSSAASWPPHSNSWPCSSIQFPKSIVFFPLYWL